MRLERGINKPPRVAIETRDMFIRLTGLQAFERKQEAIKLIIEVSGGVVQAVYAGSSADRLIEAVVVGHDNASIGQDSKVDLPKAGAISSGPRIDPEGEQCAAAPLPQHPRIHQP
jgi:hypothetical protein